MALSVKVPRKQKALPKRVKFGLPGCPIEKGFDACKYYFQYDVDKKILNDISKAFIKSEFNKDDARAILANPEYHFNLYTHLVAAIYWNNAGQEFDERTIKYFRRAKEYFAELISPGKQKLSTEVDPAEVAVVKLNPQQLLAQKVQSTIMVDLDQLEDDWIDDKKTEIKLYERFKAHDLKGMAVPLVRKRVDRWLSEYSDAYNKTCPQATEAYSHIPRPELKRRLSVINSMIADLDKVKAATKATRQPRAPKTKAADKQIQRLQYLKESNEYKLMSVNPIQIPSAHRLYTFNIKTRALTEYVCSSTSGFEVKGTTISNIDSELSRTVRLRKPDEMLPIVLSKTVKQIENEWNKLTTKSSVPNGRLNKDTILLRVMDK